MRRREFIKAVVGLAVIWPLAARAQRPDKTVIGFLSARSAKESEHLVDAFRKGLAEQGIVRPKCHRRISIGRTAITNV